MALGFKANEIDENVLNSLINSSLTNLKDLLYPVGCIVQTTAYSTVSEMREAYGGNDWELITNRVLMGAGDTYSVGETGGSDSVTLTTANLPSHNHTYSRSSTTTGSTTLTVSQIPSHNHNFGVTKDSEVGYVPANSMIGSATVRTNAIGISNTGGTFTDRAGNTSCTTIVHNTGDSGSHSHSISRTSTTTGSTGSGTSIDITPSYYSIYIWTRTA